MTHDPRQWPGTSPATGSATGPGDAAAPMVSAAPATPAAVDAPDTPDAETSASSGPGASDAGVRYVAERLLAAVREDLGRADAKAAILLSGAVALVAVLLSARHGIVADARTGGDGRVAFAFALAGGVLWAGGVAGLVAVLMPRTRVAADMTFIRELTSGSSPAELMPKLAESGEDVVRWTLGQACALGAVLSRKYRWLRVGICCLALGAFFTLFGEMW